MGVGSAGIFLHEMLACLAFASLALGKAIFSGFRAICILDKSQKVMSDFDKKSYTSAQLCIWN